MSFLSQQIITAASRPGIGVMTRGSAGVRKDSRTGDRLKKVVRVGTATAMERSCLGSSLDRSLALAVLITAAYSTFDIRRLS